MLHGKNCEQYKFNENIHKIIWLSVPKLSEEYDIWFNII